MTSPRIINIHREEEIFVFAEPKTLSWGETSIDKREGTHRRETFRRKLDYGPKYWYGRGWAEDGGTKLTDRWLYLFVLWAKSPGSRPRWYVLHEYWVDSAGTYWRTDEKALFQGRWEDQKFASLEQRQQAHDKRKAEHDAGTLGIRVPHYVAGQKCQSIVSIAMAFPIDTAGFKAFLSLSLQTYLPPVLLWPNGASLPTIAATKAPNPEDFGPHPLRRLVTVDPLEIAVRTNRVYCRTLDEYNRVYQGQTDRQLFARELYDILYNDSNALDHVNSYLQKQDYKSPPRSPVEEKQRALSGLYDEFRDVQTQLKVIAQRYENLARVLADFLRSRLFFATANAYRWEESTEHESNIDGGESSNDATIPRPPLTLHRERDEFVYFLHKFQAALERLAAAPSGDKLYQEMAEMRGRFGRNSFIPDYIFPHKPHPSSRVGKVKNGFYSILKVYSFLLPKLEFKDKMAIYRGARKSHYDFLLESIGVSASFERISAQDLELSSHWLTFQSPIDDVLEGVFIPRADYERIKKAAARATAQKISNRAVHTNIQTVAGEVGLALDAISLALTTADIIHKTEKGQTSFAQVLNHELAYVVLVNAVSSAYLKRMFGEAAAESAVTTLSRATGVLNVVQGLCNFTDFIFSGLAGDFEKATGFVMCGVSACGGAAVIFWSFNPYGLFALGMFAVGVIGSMIVSAFTLDQFQEFIRFCEWGIGSERPRQLNQTPHFSAYSFAEWKGNVRIQRDALTRLMGVFEVKSIYRSTGDVGIEIRLNMATPETVAYLYWDFSVEYDEQLTAKFQPLPMPSTRKQFKDSLWDRAEIKHFHKAGPQEVVYQACPPTRWERWWRGYPTLTEPSGLEPWPIKQLHVVHLYLTVHVWLDPGLQDVLEPAMIPCGPNGHGCRFSVVSTVPMNSRMGTTLEYPGGSVHSSSVRETHTPPPIPDIVLKRNSGN